MAEPTTEAPQEYDRTPVYDRPVGGIVRVMDRLLTGKTQQDAIKEE